MSSYPRQQLENYLKTLDVKADKVLDVGGAQKPIKGRTKSWEVGNYQILDLENPHEGEKPDILCDIQKTFPGFGNEFDLAFCLEVAEYWYDPLSALKNINESLVNDGVLYISFPFIYPVHKPTGLDYLRYTKYGTIKLLEEAGFEIAEIVSRYENGMMAIMRWFHNNGMKADQSFAGHNEIGYIIKAIKK